MKILLQSILAQSVLHLLSYAGVLALLIFALWQACVLRGLKKMLATEAARIRAGNLKRPELEAMLHPLAKCLLRFLELPDGSVAALRRAAEYAEANLFLPLKSRIIFCRDASTLAGLIATLIAIFTASGEFARSGKAELLVGSVGNGVIATVIAAISCLLALANASSLSHLRLSTASECEGLFLEPFESGSLPQTQRVSADLAAETKIAPAAAGREGWSYVI